MMFLDVLEEMREKYPLYLNKLLAQKGLNAISYVDGVPDINTNDYQIGLYLNVERPFSYDAESGSGMMQVVIDCVLNHDMAESNNVEAYLECALEVFQRKTFGIATGDMQSFLAKMDGGDDFNGFAIAVIITTCRDTDVDFL